MVAKQESGDANHVHEAVEPFNPRLEDYTVGIVCALPLELAAIRGMLDTEHSTSSAGLDSGSFILGSIRGHNVVLAVLTGAGTTDATTTALQILNDFTSIRFGLMVGIGGGVPSATADIRLGDVVVSMPSGTSPGVIQFDRGKRLDDHDFVITGTLDKPPKVLIDAVNRVESNHLMGQNHMFDHLDSLVSRWPAMRTRYQRPAVESDFLFQSEYRHAPGQSCSECDRAYLVTRLERPDSLPEIFRGTIGSSNAVLRDAQFRDTLASQDVLCVEMEAAGLMDSFPCLVIRGICDYADSHKHKVWQGYAAAAAAAYACELLNNIPPATVQRSELAKDVVKTEAIDDFLLPNVNIIWTVPDENIPIPIGRDDAYAKFKKTCKTGMNWKDLDHKIIGLEGDDWRCQIAFMLNFAQLVRPKFWAVFLIQASSEEEIRKELLEQVAPHLKTDDWREAKAWIEELKEHWLFLLLDTSKIGDDDYTKRDPPRVGTSTWAFEKYIPRSSGGLVVYASDCHWTGATLGFQDLFRKRPKPVSKEILDFCFYPTIVVLAIAGFLAIIALYGALLKYMIVPIVLYFEP
ncbi:Hypothetical protein D9617_2g054360 [Elsinoe fawcettii]|nr:Hypothetical protein D9617_2g054360 [Elsinoe fawcettii]